jgi:hypothetical protein
VSAGDALLELEALLPGLPAAVDGRRLGEGLGRATASLRTADRQVDRIGAILDLSALLEYGLAGPQAEMVGEVRDAAAFAGESLESAETAADLERAVSAFERELATAINNLDRNLAQHWRLVTSRRFEPMVAIGNLLSRIDEGSDLGRKLAACGASARAVPDGIGGRALLDRARQLIEERATLESRRRQELGEGDVANFVNALAEDRASLAMITDEVWGWLEENHALERLKVRPA